MQATGTFDITLTPQETNAEEGTPLARLSIDKTFYGDLEGRSVGVMLSAVTATKGSAGYVALERVSGTLAGRHGTFVLQHSGTMRRGEQTLALTVVPDSGTGELTGLSGSMRIIIEGGAHSYEFEYAMEEGGEG